MARAFPLSLLRRDVLTVLAQGLNPKTGHLELATTPNQDPLLDLTPIIGVDIWEHAFYLQYLNVKADVRNLSLSSLLIYSYNRSPCSTLKPSGPSSTSKRPKSASSRAPSSEFDCVSEERVIATESKNSKCNNKSMNSAYNIRLAM
jgi:hypothetical protein